MSINDIIDEALALKPQDRYLIIENLTKSLSQPNPEIDELWIKESEKRLESIQNGDMPTVTYEEVFGA